MSKAVVLVENYNIVHWLFEARRDALSFDDKDFKFLFPILIIIIINRNNKCQYRYGMG